MKRGMSQEQLAERAGMSGKFLGEIERGTGNPTIDTLGSLADALELGVAHLLGVPAPAPPRGHSVPLDRRALAKIQRAAALLFEAVGRTKSRPWAAGRSKP